ncbi:MAG: nucleotidyltransferase domain-containing protein [Lachnospiraceae bacterium]|nr:nucleotidyltransferase domain-containing protein [Lachnospiraceae bacterium]
MFKIDLYIPTLIELLKVAYKERLLYVGLQGSYLRGEATDHSDIDIMVVISDMSVVDLAKYREAISSLENYDKSCGFICGIEDLQNWNPLEICHLLHTTKDYYGTLEKLIPEYTETNVRNFVKMSVGNLYHEICHRYIHAPKEKNIAKLPFTYRSVFFILQNLYYLSSGKFIGTKKELREALSGKDRLVLDTAISLSNGTEFDFDEAFDLLFTWCKETMVKI